MKTNGGTSYEMKKKIKVGIIVILLFVCIGTILDISTLAFEDVLPSDKILIEKDGEVFLEIDDPSLLIEEGFGTGFYDTVQLGLNRFLMKTKYEIAFLKEDKVLAKYKILTPKTEKAIAKVKTDGGCFQ